VGWAEKTRDGAFWRARRAIKARIIAHTVMPRVILKQLGLVAVALVTFPFRLVGFLAGRLIR